MRTTQAPAPSARTEPRLTSTRPSGTGSCPRPRPAASTSPCWPPGQRQLSGRLALPCHGAPHTGSPGRARWAAAGQAGDLGSPSLPQTSAQPAPKGVLGAGRGHAPQLGPALMHTHARLWPPQTCTRTHTHVPCPRPGAGSDSSPRGTPPHAAPPRGPKPEMAPGGHTERRSLPEAQPWAPAGPGDRTDQEPGDRGALVGRQRSGERARWHPTERVQRAGGVPAGHVPPSAPGAAVRRGPGGARWEGGGGGGRARGAGVEVESPPGVTAGGRGGGQRGQVLLAGKGRGRGVLGHPRPRGCSLPGPPSPPGPPAPRPADPRGPHLHTET